VRIQLLLRLYLINGAFYPVNDLLRILKRGRATTKAQGRPAQLFWDSDYQGLKIKENHIRLLDFQQFVKDTIALFIDVMDEELLAPINHYNRHRFLTPTTIRVYKSM
jgi:hypothetical protein